MLNLVKFLKIMPLLLIIPALLPTFIYAESTPPPPPPPCPIQSAGCYKTGDIKAGFGELTTAEFGHFLTENKCKKTDQCDCRGVPDNVPQEANPDDSSGACNCISGTDWNARGRCCGDDADDCGKISSGVLCSIDANAETAQWLPSTPNLGDMRYVGCSRLEYISDGNDWLKCDGVFWKRTISSSEYICIGRGRESIVECCGDSSWKSRVDGKRLSTGQSVTPSSHSGNLTIADDRTYYCRSDGKFVTDLDTPNSRTSDTMLNNKNKKTCEMAGLKWTGTKCCSEADDADEYYNDPGDIGGCWNKNLVVSVDFVNGTNEAVVNYEGEFHGCALEQSAGISSILDRHTGATLVTSHPPCFNDPENNYYCSPSGKWLPTDGANRSHSSSTPLANASRQSECCAPNECWDGQMCVENQRDNPLAQPTNSRRCIDGAWEQAEIRTSVDGSASGYCPERMQCLVNVFEGNETSQCINNGQYVEDNLCENGQWSSRTKLLALKLLKMKSGDFTLFCDKKENTLNNLQYLTGSNDIVANVLSDLETNNFCVLKNGNRVIAATSINKDLDDIPDNSLAILGVTSCDNALIDDGQYHSCDSTNKAWFNKQLKSFIYSAAAITVPPEQNQLNSFEELILNPIRNIVNSIRRLITTPPFDASYVSGIRKFDKLYLEQRGSRSIGGSIEGKELKNAVIEYKNFDIDICKFVDAFNEARRDSLSGISCKKEGNNYYVLAQGSRLSNLNPEAIWQDLTSKLRVK
ncbi:hypothetical protein HYY71_02505 [Candidatus Woesearchaeota archaeon]|nr:hypothetical protein [Candidatus Woesearchaeota archaeon]